MILRILAYIEGSEKPNEVLVISGHYDHVGMKNGNVYNGADDDGSGTVALLEIAQAFQKQKKRRSCPKRSILFFM
jgi:Zn-dependent M28 family amino/carboxypeptidase